MSETTFAEATSENHKGGHGNHTITITVNNKPVSIVGPRVTPIDIKQAAIAAGLPVQLDFQVAEIRHGEAHILGDDETITVTKHSVFSCTAGDDNSSGESEP